MQLKDDAMLIARLIKTVGGKLVGRIRLQKIMYILQVAGLDSNLVYQYYHYGPYCEELADAADYGAASGLFKEEEVDTAWGTAYSVYTANNKVSDVAMLPEEFTSLAQKAADSSSVILELAAMALYLSKEECVADAWGETAARKQQKAKDGRIEMAKELYGELKNLCPPLPAIGD